MNLLWSMPIPCLNSVYFQYEGVFTHGAGQRVFVHAGSNDLVHVVSPVDGQPQLLRTFEVPGRKLSSQWQLMEETTPPLLLLTEKCAADLHEMKLVTHDLPFKTYHACPRYQLGEYCIEYHEGYTIFCTQNGQDVWKYRIQAYLYTPVRQWRDLIYFGTAGSGGYFYILRLETGEVVAAIRTGGTVHIAQEGSVCYILANTPKARLLKVDMSSGAVMEEVPLPGKAQYSSLRLMDGEVHAITYTFRNRQLSQVIWNCVAI